MDRRLHILREICDNPRISQRKLAKSLELSLGTVNALMQKLESEEVITATQINGKMTEYLLTASGYKLKAELSRIEAIHCYRYIGEMRALIKEHMEKLIEDGVNRFVFYGEEDEIFKLLKMTFFDLKRFYDISYVVTQSSPDNNENGKVIVWEEHRLENDEMIHILMSD